MNGTLVVAVSLVAGIGVFIAAMAMALPRASSAPDLRPPWELPPTSESSLRSKVNRPLRAIVERTNRRHRLNGGLSLAENLARADIKLRASEFVMIQLGFLLGAALLCLWRFGFAPQFVVAAVLNVITPSYFRVMLTDPAGRVLLGLAGLSIFIGNRFVRRITSFKV